MRVQFEDTEDVFKYIQENVVQTVFRGEPQRFLRKAALDEVTSKETILLVTSDDEDVFLDEDGLERFADQVVKFGRQMFATCVQGSLPMTCLQLLLENGLTDTDMPLTEDNFPGSKKTKRRFVGSFIPNQALFSTAYFHLDSFQDLTGLTKPIDHDESTLIGKGAFGAVYTVQIHEEHRAFASGNTKDEFAMKVTQQKGTRELPYHQAMASLSHPHLVKCHASFTFASYYHMIFEKADGNLEELMQTHRDAPILRSLTPDYLAQQLAGTINAVSVIHTQLPPDDGASQLGVPKLDIQKSGYLHDIKPDNILVFRYRQAVWFRLADFSCAKVVDYVASVSGLHRQSWKSTGKSGTPIYRPPESTTEGKTSRPYDIWSLGCVLIEALVWYTEGYAALDTFRTSRTRMVKPRGIEDQGFYYIDENGKGHLREQVVDRLKTIPLRCEGHLRTIANVIPQMLEINPRDRPTAEQLVNRLKVIDQPSSPPNLLTSASTVDLSHTRTNQSASPTYISDSDSDFGPVIKIQVQHPTNE
ncbi:kinase-like domain-containing protein [Boeremia exigua]|uniref:kinase-like domain-containing protein n=1 Tax=Boeremia exigua TaxID=749465 RepID=UPI001E8E0A1D|nr:kinase-like domain-containing protein [Boeremia exigua]KAH6639406.1 kinase-like domain-containing protein [Boeremia exigua]